MSDKKRILITGITGFVGSHLAEYLLSLKEDLKVYGITRWRSPKDNIKSILNKITLVNADLTDLKSLIDTMLDVRPDIIFHLGAQSYVPFSFKCPIQTLETNVIGTANLLEAVRDTEIDPIIHICSSSETYGQVTEDDVPIKEDCPFRPASPYGVSKVGEDMLAYQYHVSYGMKTIRTRMFTHTGPKRGEVFFVSAFAKQIAKIKLGLQDKIIKVGNLDSVRTICDVRDAVKAYWLLVNKCPPGEVYNIGGDATMTVGEILNKMIKIADIACKIEIDPKLLRPSDVTLQIPCCDKFKKTAGWNPEIPLEQTLKDTIDYWEDELKQTLYRAH